MAYVTLAELKNALGITDTDRDDLLNSAIDSASAMIDSKTGRTFERTASTTARTYRIRSRTVRDTDGEALTVDDIADDTGLTVETGDGDTWTAVDDYDTEPDNALDLGRPITRIRLINAHWNARKARVTAIWGWPAVPDDITQAALLQATRLYRRKDSPEGVAGSAEWGLIRMPNLDPDVRALVAPYMLPGFG